MAKKPTPKRKSTTRIPLHRRLHFWPALIVGLLLVGLCGFLWVRSSQAAFGTDLLRKLPKDSYVAGVARISQFDSATVNQLSRSTRIDTARAATLLQTLQSGGVDQAKLKSAVGDQFAFARTNRGDLAIFTVAQEADFADVAKRLTSHAANVKTTELQTSSGTLQVWQGLPAGSQQVVSAYRSGRELYLATNPDLIVGASRETNGFTTLDQFPAVSKQLPAGADAYVFLNVSQLREPPVAFPLTGVAVTDQKQQLKLATRVAEPAVVSETLPNTSGKLLPAPSAASAAIEGTDVAGYLHVLEEQRQESDLPRVIALQNGVASLNRKLGVDLEKDFLGQATGDFVYARYRGADGSNQWFGMIQFDSAQTAQTTATRLTQLLRERVTVPTRHERIRVLPDGTQSKEIVSEGNEALEVGDVTIEGKAGNAATFPSIGAVNWVVDGQFLALGSSPEAVARMIRTIAQPSAKLNERGELAVRAKLADTPGLMANRDGLFNWILATQPESGSFTLNKSTGELQGAVRFKPTKQ